MARLATLPLDQVPLVSLDLETTGLNTKQDRVIQVGIVNAAAPDNGIEVFVNPAIPIPANSTAIHGITDDDVAAAAPFPAVFSQCRPLLEKHVIIGYNIGFDLAVLSQEAARHGIEWHWGTAFCLRQLATIALGRDAMLMMGDLDQLAMHYQISTANRHSALGDAQISLALYHALIADLQKQSITTLGEARRAVAKLDDQRMATSRAGWIDVASQKEDVISNVPLARIDPFPYRHRISEIMMTNPLIMDAKQSLHEAAINMRQTKTDCVFIGEDNQNIRGIISERDLVHAMATPFDELARARDEPLEALMSSPVITVAETDYMHIALGKLARYDIRHLGVVNHAGHLTGWLSTRELIRQRVSDALVIGDEIQTANNAEDMAGALRKLPGLAASLLGEGVAAQDIAAVISGEYKSALARAAALAEERMRREFGPPPRAYAVLVLGSAGRDESLLAADQDHALLYDDKAQPIAPEEAEAIQGYFETCGTYISEILDKAGIPFCKGGVMSSSPKWCKSLTSWRKAIRDWCHNPSAEDLLSVDIFFDFTLVYGDSQLGIHLQQAISGRAARQPDFLKLLARNIGNHHGGTTLFGRLKLDEGRFQIKLHMTLALTEMLRVLAISRGIDRRNSAQRAGALVATKTVPPEILQLGDDIHFCMKLILRQQIQDIAEGMQPTTNIQLELCSKQEQTLIKAITGRIARLDSLLQNCLFHRP